MFKKILWVTDFSAAAQKAGQQSLACVKCSEGGSIDVLTVIDPEDLPFLEIVPNPFITMAQEESVGERLEEEYKQQVLDQLTLKTRFLRDANVPITLHIRVGIPWKEIVIAAQELGTTMIVIGSHGKRSLEDILLGSTVENVIKHAPCPVLVVR
ncbi:universal stress protein [uncultured Thermanaerothrix sp.]|uniref:universal stress protein n=1 Tax=uncultured Thermanaerothrix sp. TaxID=1195149 RepID=UPI002639AC60|nr:universal stress protein [uncultured Thermanaerothrix sp.]